ncbi:hypothetical protein [Pyrobaculum islandicum]|uniref:hypothetical protein n=1 Tax=Pyrobaculum islandicum TaxID=2277 RepID=UPI000ADD837A
MGCPVGGFCVCIRELRRLHEEISWLEERAAREADPAKRRRLEDRVNYLKSRRF